MRNRSWVLADSEVGLRRARMMPIVSPSLADQHHEDGRVSAMRIDKFAVTSLFRFVARNDLAVRIITNK